MLNIIPSPTAILYLLTALAFLRAVLGLARQYRLYKKMPPGPKGLPLLGNIFQMPSNAPWYRFAQWQEQYGPIFSLNLAGQPVVVLNTLEAAADLLDRRSYIYSDRPRMIMSGELLGQNMFMPFCQYDHRLRTFRKASQDGLSTRSLQSHHERLEKEAELLLAHSLRNPQAWSQNTLRAATSTIVGVVYGFPPIRDVHDPVMEEVDHAAQTLLKEALPGASFIDMFPSLLALPRWISPWKKRGYRGSRTINAMFSNTLKLAKDSDDIAPSQFLSHALDNNLGHIETSWMAGALFAGGVETMPSVLSVFMLAMLTHPETMLRAQAELDRVIGSERLPCLADQPHLPYILALVKEVYRWRPVGPCVPRRVKQDDYYEGYLLPKGCIVIANIWSIHRDPEIFPDFDTFRPERFLDESGQLKPPIPDTHAQGHTAFGFGRRVCVGMQLANLETFLLIASLLWAYTIETIPDENGEMKPLSTELIDNGLAAHPPAFECTLRPRSQATTELLQSLQEN